MNEHTDSNSLSASNSPFRGPTRREVIAAAVAGVLGSLATAWGATPKNDPNHLIVYHRTDEFAGWPANGGLWMWDDGKEALVAFVVGRHKEKRGHNILPPYVNTLARTRDGGETWTVEQPKGFFQDGMKLKDPPEDIDFAASGFAMRVLGEGYQGAAVAQGGIVVSNDRGRSWQGPFALPKLPDATELRGYHITSRTDYLVNGRSDCLIFSSARKGGTNRSDRVFWCRTTDGGRRWEFGGWIVSPRDAYRAVMPSTVRLSASKLVTAIRRRPVKNETCWIDAYESDDEGRSWRLLGKIGSTGSANGNPPALIRLGDRRLCRVYGNRDRREMLARLSADGAAWGEEVVLRKGYQADMHDDADLGYPRVFQRSDGKVVAVYYWADHEHPQPHIAATIWSAPRAGSQ